MASLDTYDTTHHPFRAYLGPDEIVLYHGQPDAGTYVRSTNRCFGLFAVVLLAWLAVAWLAPPGAETAVLIGGVAALGFLGLVLALRLGVQREAGDTHYGITEDRLLFWTARPHPRFTAQDLAAVSRVEVTIEKQVVRFVSPVVGTIRFGPARRPAILDRLVLPSPFAGTRVPAFTLIAEVSDVYRMVDDVRKLPSVRRLFADAPPATED